MTVSGSTFTGNTANANGGAIENTNGTLMVNYSAFVNNLSTENGGAIFETTNGTTTVTESTFSGNQATQSGGAIYNDGASLSLYGGTLSGNSAAAGGGIFNSLSGGTVTLGNTIVAGNPATSSPDVDGQIFSSSGNNLIGDGTGITGISNGSSGNQIGTSANPVVPLLSTPGNNGGPTETMIPQPGSPTICAGSVALIPSGVTTDQREAGFPNTNTTYISGSTCVDIGAVQTNYVLSFTGTGAIEPPSTVTAGVAITPAPTVVLNGGGSSATTAVTMTDSDSALTGTKSVNLGSGMATFSNLVMDSAESSDALIATMPLTGSINLTATSNTFSVNAFPGNINRSHAEQHTLTSSSATFTWTAGTGVTRYEFRLGTTGPGSNDLYNPTETSTTALTSGPVTGIPTNGATLYARLFSLIGGVW